MLSFVVIVVAVHVVVHVDQTNRILFLHDMVTQLLSIPKTTFLQQIKLLLDDIEIDFIRGRAGKCGFF